MLNFLIPREKAITILCHYVMENSIEPEKLTANDFLTAFAEHLFDEDKIDNTDGNIYYHRLENGDFEIIITYYGLQ